MKDATLLVIRNQHQGDCVVENLIHYMLSSPFADTSEILANGMRIDSMQHMVEDIYAVQEPLNMDHHRRMFHMVLTTRVSKDQQRNLDAGANAVCDYFVMLGHQTILVPHYGSADNYMNYHWHLAVNPISYQTGQRLWDKYETYGAIVQYLNENTIPDWGWKYKNVSRATITA